MVKILYLILIVDNVKNTSIKFIIMGYSQLLFLKTFLCIKTLVLIKYTFYLQSKAYIYFAIQIGLFFSYITTGASMSHKKV